MYINVRYVSLKTSLIQGIQPNYFYSSGELNNLLWSLLLALGAKLSKLKPSYDSWLTFHLSHFSRPGLAASPATTSPASSWRTRQQQTKKNFYRSSNYQTLTCQKTKLISINMHVKKWIYHTESSLRRWTKLLAWRWKRLNGIWSTLPAQILSWFLRARVQ